MRYVEANNYFLKKAIENENKYKINLKTKKCKQNIMYYMSFIRNETISYCHKEIIEIVSKDWNI